MKGDILPLNAVLCLSRRRFCYFRMLLCCDFRSKDQKSNYSKKKLFIPPPKTFNCSESKVSR